jgi:hypothetical protein
VTATVLAASGKPSAIPGDVGVLTSARPKCRALAITRFGAGNTTAELSAALGIEENFSGAFCIGAAEVVVEFVALTRGQSGRIPRDAPERASD